MEDFRMYTSWRGHRKRKRLRARLGADGVMAIEDLWAYAADCKTDGDLTGMTDEDIAVEVDYPGDPHELVATLVELHLLDGEPGAYRIHDWVEHQPWVVARPERSKQGQKARHQRAVNERAEHAATEWCADTGCTVSTDGGTAVYCEPTAGVLKSTASTLAVDGSATPALPPSLPVQTRNAEVPEKDASTGAAAAPASGSEVTDRLISADELLAYVGRLAWLVQPASVGKARHIGSFSVERLSRARAACENAGGTMSLDFLLEKYKRAGPGGVAGGGASRQGGAAREPPSRATGALERLREQESDAGDRETGLAAAKEILGRMGA